MIAIRPLHAVAAYGRMIKFSHSVFALPFALSGAAMAATRSGVTLSQIGWIALAMVGARSAAMGCNRLADRHIDAANPRTSNRELPQGVVSTRAVWLMVLLSSALLVWAAHRLNPLCLYLSPLALLILLSYSYTKRFTWASHLVLGLSLGLAPVGAWIAVTGSVTLVPVGLGRAVLAWVAGCDILYACQDHAFDVAAGLHSIPARFGLRRSLHVARFLHALTVILMLIVADLMGLNSLYLLGVAVIAGLLFYEHRLVKVEDLTRVNTAFMTMNSIVSVGYLTFTLADLLLLGDGGSLLQL